MQKRKNKIFVSLFLFVENGRGTFNLPPFFAVKFNNVAKAHWKGSGSGDLVWPLQFAYLAKNHSL